MFEYQVGQFAFKTVIEGQNSEFYYIVENNTIRHRYNSRLIGTLQRPRIDKAKCRNSMDFKFVEIWNKVPEEIRDSESLPSFKTKFKRHLLAILS